LSSQPFLLVGAALLLGGVVLSKTSARFGVPSLLLFLGMGMVAGSEGLGGVEFDDFETARDVGVVALAFILFGGGLTTSWPRVRPVLGEAVALASIGVLVTAGVLGLAATAILRLDLAEAMLLAAIVASTDAAAVFSILRSRGIGVKGGLKPLLELESGSNDPAAVFVTVAVIGLIEATGPGIAGLSAMFVYQMAVGALAGYLLARTAVWAINRARLEYDGLYPVLTVAFVLVCFEGVNTIGASGFLAAYVAGLTMANHEFLHKRSLLRFHDAIAWLAQIAMFTLLGLLVFPSELPEVALRGVAVALLLMLVARPVAVFVVLAPFRVPWRHSAFVSWLGLRGATPIILATFPVVEGIEGSDTIFNVVFFVVLTSVLLQGSTMAWAARVLGLAEPSDETRSYPIESVLSSDEVPDLHELIVPEGSPAADQPIVALDLPADVLVVLLHRGQDRVVPEGATVVRAGDHLLVLAEDGSLEAMRRMLEPS
jgi:cell volume regulation protein A